MTHIKQFANIKDDGIGISEEKIKELLSINAAKNRVGIYNINQRFKKYMENH